MLATGPAYFFNITRARSITTSISGRGRSRGVASPELVTTLPMERSASRIATPVRLIDAVAPEAAATLSMPDMIELVIRNSGVEIPCRRIWRPRRKPLLPSASGAASQNTAPNLPMEHRLSASSTELVTLATLTRPGGTIAASLVTNRIAVVIGNPNSHFNGHHRRATTQIAPTHFGSDHEI